MQVLVPGEAADPASNRRDDNNPSERMIAMTDELATDLDAALTASRALLGVVARSVAEALEQVTLPQFRVLVVLSTQGTMRVSSLAQRINAVPSTFSRTVDRMVSAGWLHRTPNPKSRREILIDLTPAGRQLVASVTRRRRRELRKILSRLTPEQRTSLTNALRLFGQAAGEPSVDDLLPLGL